MPSDPQSGHGITVRGPRTGSKVPTFTRFALVGIFGIASASFAVVKAVPDVHGVRSAAKNPPAHAGMQFCRGARQFPSSTRPFHRAPSLAAVNSAQYDSRVTAR